MELELYVYAHWNKYNREVEYQLSTYKRGSSSGDVLLEEKMIEVLPQTEREIKVKLAASLKMQLSDLRADHQQEQNEILETINQLLALEFKPEVVAADKI